MNQRKILGYSIFFKDEKEAQKFYDNINEKFDAEINKEEKEVIIIGIEKVKREDFAYVFRKDGYKVSVEPLKIISLQTLFVRE